MKESPTFDTRADADKRRTGLAGFLAGIFAGSLLLFISGPIAGAAIACVAGVGAIVIASRG